MHVRPVLRSCICTWCLPRTLRAQLGAVFDIHLKYSAHFACRPSFTLTMRATLPVGAGLGSSAAFSVCATTALMLITGRISPPSDRGPGSLLQEPELSRSLADTVNVYAFLSEKIMHGNPSGVDNSVAVHGGGLLYTKSIPSEGKQGGMVSIEGYVISIITTW